MIFNKDTAVERAKDDLAGRAGVDKSDIETLGVSDKEFPDMSLGAPADGEMAAQMISYGWLIKLAAGGKDYEYRADKFQLRLVGRDGSNKVIT